MSEVDPFQIPIPRAFSKTDTPDEIEVHEYFLYLHRYLHDMWIRSGGGNDDLEAILGVIEGDPEATLPGGEEPAWEGQNWQFWSIP